MRTRKLFAALLGVAALCWLFPPRALAEVDQELLNMMFTWWGDIQLGAQAVDVNGDRTAKFEEYREVPRGFFLDSFDLSTSPKDRPYFFEIGGKDVLQEDQEYRASFGKVGSLKVDFTWNQTPHLFSTGSRTLLTQQDGTFVFNDIGDRQFFTDNDPSIPAGQITPTPGELATVARTQELIDNADTLDLRLRRDEAKVSFVYSPLSQWNVRWSFSQESREGTRAISVGTYERRGTATGDTFRVLGIELPEPIDHRTLQARVGTDYSGKGWLIDFEYGLSVFRNDIDALLWQNPFNNTDESGGALNRGRFDEAQLDLAPDNEAHTFALSGSVTLPWETQFTGAVSYGFFRQDDPFLPYTLNTAILATNVAGTPRAMDLALPQESLDGEVQTISQSYTLTNRLLKDIVLAAFYRFYDYDNDTPLIEFPGYAAFGDTAWRTAIDAIPPNPAEPIENRPPSYTKNNAGLEGTWRILKPVSLKLGYEFEGWDREHRQADQTSEHIAKAALDVKPARWMSARASYQHGDRSVDSYDPGVKEFSQLRMFDQADRVRDMTDVIFQFTPWTPLSFSTSGLYGREDFDESPSGLTFHQRYGVAADVSYVPTERLSLYAYYARDFDRYEMNSVAKTGGTTEATIFNPVNAWDSETKDTIDSAGAGLRAGLSARLTLDLSYNFSFGRGAIFTTNPNTIQSSAQLSAEAFPYPDVKSTFHQVNVALRYALSKLLTAGLKYTFESYDLDDFQWDQVDPVLFDTTQDNTSHYLAIDSRYSDYSAHVVGGYVSFRF